MSAPAVASEARTRVDRIKTGVEVVWTLIVESYQARDWEALGYGTWDEMCTREFGTSRLRLPREERAETVQSLREAGLSLRAIASATGDSVTTVRRELAGVPNGTPDSGEDDDLADEPDGFAEKIAAELAASDGGYADRAQAVVDNRTGEVVEPDDKPLTEAECEALDAANRPAPTPEPKVTGLDGKKYDAGKPKTKPNRKPLGDAAQSAGWELRRAVERIERIIADDRYGQNAEQVALALRGHLSYAAETVAAVIDQLPSTSGA